MSDLIEKYAKFINLLSKKTKQSKIPWEYDFNKKSISVWNGDILLNITKATDENWEDTYQLSIYNKAGDFIEGFDDGFLTGAFSENGEESYYSKMRDLFTLAMRQATGADKALDDFIKAIENDSLDIPF